MRKVTFYFCLLPEPIAGSYVKRAARCAVKVVRRSRIQLSEIVQPEVCPSREQEAVQ